MLSRMYAVERLGSYITRGVYTVSGPFHPFGGAVDIIVVEQQDGSFKTSPWYVRFGKFQGVLKTREKEVIINVNGVNADFNMYLDHKGEAYFLKEVDVEEPQSILYQSSSGEDTDGNKSNERRPLKSKSCNFDAAERDLNLPRSGSRRARLLGLVFGRKSIKGSNFEQGEGATNMVRANSLERAEIAADLLDVKWSTDLATKRPGKDKASRFSGPSMLDQNLEFSGEEIEGSQTVHEIIENYLDCPNKHDTSTLEVNTAEVEVNSVLYVETSKSCVGNSEHDNQETNSGNEKEVIERVFFSEGSRLGLRNTNEKLSEIIYNDVAEESSNHVDDLKEEGEIQLRQGLNILSSESFEEEQFLFSDLDNLKVGEVLFTESIPPEFVEKLNLPSPTYLANESSDLDHELLPSSDKQISCPIDIVRSHPVGVEGVTRRAESLPNLWSNVDDELGVLDIRQHCHSMNLDTKSSKWILLRKNVSAFIKSSTEVEKLLAEGELATRDNQISRDLLHVPTNLAVADSYEVDPSKVIVAPTGSWGMWPFSFKRSTTLNAIQIEPNVTKTSDVENVPESPTGTVRDKTELKSKATKKKIRLFTPTSEQLASLNLKPGKNIVTFMFSTAMLGKQQVDARIYLWRWNTRIVISDVDGTITKSDVLGQFMPWVGVDWSQTGVAHFFTDIKDNGYQLLFLSARAISQAYLTRQFLFNLKQDGKALPDGPVVISPDGLFPSLYREVIRRAPHEFKIACLENIKALFPSDCSPFYAGFGNRDTDEISYLKVGIPKGKIFIINPKGEVAVNRRVDTKSYPSLRTLVHDMFPPISSTEQEDFNSWNFWKLP